MPTGRACRDLEVQSACRLRGERAFQGSHRQHRRLAEPRAPARGRPRCLVRRFFCRTEFSFPRLCRQAVYEYRSQRAVVAASSCCSMSGQEPSYSLLGDRVVQAPPPAGWSHFSEWTCSLTWVSGKIIFLCFTLHGLFEKVSVIQAITCQSEK